MKLTPQRQGYLFFIVILVLHSIAIGIMTFGANPSP
jgi:hypothetical protein